ncbi:MAG: ParB N-terminal domain-containing protein, partial [Steroidobacteraceae bacterium]
GSRFRRHLPNQKNQEQTMEQTIELRIVDPKTLTYADKRDPRQVPADRLSDAALKANTNAIGFVQPPLFSEEDDGTLTIIAGRRRIKSAIANKLKEMAILVKPADPLDDMRAVAENVVRAPLLGSVSQLSCWVRTAVTAIGDIHGAYRGRHADVRVKCSRSEARTTLDAAATPQAF